MQSLATTQLLRTTSRFLFGPESAPHLYDNPCVARALALLVDEFLQALGNGSQTLISVPDSMRAHKAPLVTVIRAMFVEPQRWVEFLEEFSLLDGNPTLKLAEIYAEWVVEHYQLMGAFDD